MNCPKCEANKLTIYNSRYNGEYTWRRRLCENCGYKFSTAEITVELYEELKKKEADLAYMLGLLEGVKP